MNQPLGSCFGYIHEVVSLADELENYKKRHQPQQSMESDESILATDTGMEDRFMEDAIMDCDTVTMDDGAESGGRFVQDYDGAARTFGRGTTFMQQFECDEFAEERTQNLFYPFASRAEWELASFLLRSDLSLAALDKFLSLNLVRPLL
jgi:hypothetical protein